MAKAMTGDPRRVPARVLLSLVIPTRNESENIAPLLAELAGVIPAAVPAEVIFVDDSDDDTVETIRSTATRLPVRIVHREPGARAGGLSTAEVAGFEEARGEYVCVLDADLQHPPMKVPEMLDRAVETGADIVVASRYLKGGSARGLGGLGRRLASRGSGLLATALFFDRLRHATDPGGNFYLFRRSIIAGAALRPVGYKMLLEIMVRCDWQGLEEVPYHFVPRERGDTSASAAWRNAGISAAGRSPAKTTTSWTPAARAWSLARAT